MEFSYPVSNTGRIAGVTSARGNGAASRTFTYGYETNSALLKSLAITGSHDFTITREFESTRDLIVSVEAKWSTTSRTKYAYVYNDLRQRQSVVQTGDVFADYGGADSGAIHQIFTYNARGELTAAGTFLGATATDQTYPLSARKHEFDYDGIGNRKSSNTSGDSGLRDDYTVNELNQYTLKENNTLAVGGTVANDANIKVAARLNGLAGRQGRHWGDNITLENWVAPFQGTLTVYAVNATTNKKHIQTRTAFIPPAAQAMTYDEDGNITNDGVWTYSWDAENRLWAMETTANAIAGGVPAQRLEFKYDYLHRRVEKKVLTGSGYTTVASQRRYLYDGWSMIAEFSVSGGSTLTLARSYTWGLDIAKSLTDAGGVGALLQIRDYTTNKDYLPSYDGNGNIAALFDADASSSSTACMAAYEYSPYGEFLRCEGTYAKENPFRFSTKFADDETGLVYYGYRYYSPNQGRFLGRDPIAESGGLNLYGFCGNNGINRWDVLGMNWICDSRWQGSDGNTYGGWDLWLDRGEDGTELAYTFDSSEAAEAALLAVNMGGGQASIDFAGIAAADQYVTDTLAMLGGATTWVNPSDAPFGTVTVGTPTVVAPNNVATTAGGSAGSYDSSIAALQNALSTAQRLTAMNGNEYGGVITQYSDGTYGYTLFKGDRVAPGLPATVSFPTTGSIGIEFHSHPGNTPPSITDLQNLPEGTQGNIITRDGAIYNYSTTLTPLGDGLYQANYNVNVVRQSPSSQDAIYDYSPDIIYLGGSPGP